MKKQFLTILTIFNIGFFLQAQNPCNDGKIIINGDDIDAVNVIGNNKQGLTLPIWLEANSTVAAGNRVKLISVIEFNLEPQAGGGNSLVFNQVISVSSAPQTVPTNKVWKIEGFIKYSDPFSSGLSASANSPICFNDNLNLTSSVSGATYAWTGPGSFTSSNQNPTINNADFTNIGTYYLTATHNGCTYSDSVNVVVNPLPASTFSNTYAIENYASTFTPTVSGQNYSWTFASGSPTSSNAQNPQVTWTTAGSYNVDLTVTDGNNCSSTTQQNVTVSNCFVNDPNSDFNWGAAIANYATAFTPDVSGAASYNWSFDNGNPATSSQQNPSITWSSAGTYTVTLTVSTGSACYTTTQNVTVSNCLINQPESDFSWTTAVANNNVTFTPNDMTATTYAWTFDQATPNSSSTQSPNNIQWSSGGTYDVTLVTDFSGVGCFTTTQQVTVGVLFTYTGSQQTFTVPSGITSVFIEVWGAEGGGSNASYRGKGGYAEGELSVTQGQTLYIYVGGQGSGATGGFNGGGNGNSSSNGGGGGGSDVRVGGNTFNDRVIVAGGGGGGYGSSYYGGDGGGLVGGNGTSNQGGSIIPYGGTQSSGGACGGTFGVGGSYQSYSGGGGGGGWFGGGSNNCQVMNNGGGGGSGYIGGVTNGSMQTGGRSGDGQVIIYW